jgi:hypothetical protein
MKTRTRVGAVVAGALLTVIALAAPGSARPLPTDGKIVSHSGSCARVIIGTRGACKFPTSPLSAKAHRAAMRDNHGRRAAVRETER